MRAFVVQWHDRSSCRGVRTKNNYSTKKAFLATSVCLRTSHSTLNMKRWRKTLKLLISFYDKPNMTQQMMCDSISLFCRQWVVSNFVQLQMGSDTVKRNIWKEKKKKLELSARTYETMNNSNATPNAQLHKPAGQLKKKEEKNTAKLLRCTIEARTMLFSLQILRAHTQ